MTKIGKFVQTQTREQLLQLLPYNAVINPTTRKTLVEEIIPEAPSGGKTYGRQDKEWVESYSKAEIDAMILLTLNTEI